MVTREIVINVQGNTQVVPLGVPASLESSDI